MGKNKLVSDMERGFEALQPTNHSSVVAIAVSGGKQSKSIVKCALEKFGQVHFKFIHVRPVRSWIPTPMGKYIPISHAQDEVIAAFRKEDERHINVKLLPFTKMCNKRQVEVDILKVESDEVETAIALEIQKHKICKLVIGTSARGIFSRGPNLSSKIAQSCPNFCTVYAVSKGKLSSIRESDSETSSSIREALSIGTSHSSDSSSSHYLSSRTEWTDQGSKQSFRYVRSASLPAQGFHALSTIDENLLHKRMPSNISVSSFNNGQISQTSGSRCIVSPSRDQQSQINFELEKLAKHIKGMYATAQDEAIDTSRVLKINSLKKLRLGEEIKPDPISISEQKAEELARKENDRYEAARKEAEFVLYGAEKVAGERKEAEIQSEKTRDLKFVPRLPRPYQFVCPILMEVMNDPCVAADGYTYDRKAIEEWLQEKDTSPVTDLLLPHKLLVPNYTLLSAIMDWEYSDN